MKNSESPHLAPPGAGLPWIELQIARLIFAIRCHRGNPASFLGSFREEQEKIRSLVDAFPIDHRCRRILIARAVGLEDSSRHYSAWMVLDHLRIVNDACVDIITSLLQEEKINGAVSTAAVKPDPSADFSVETRYEASCKRVIETLQSAGDLKTRPRFSHPWFGPLDAHGWASMVSMHMGIHRNQLALMLRKGF